MNPLAGFVSVPRTELNRPAGASFFATVEAKTGDGLWRVRLDGKLVTVQSDLELIPGQTLRLRLASNTHGKWVFQILPLENAPKPSPPDQVLVAAFFARGLPMAAEKISIWTRWMAKPGPSDKADWAAALDARSQTPDSSMARAIEPWLAWQSALERGENPPQPQDDPWDLWNAKRPAGHAWLVLPLRWEYQGHGDSGLLQARWNPVAQMIDRWNLTAAPAGVPFRLEASSRLGHLDLMWRFFDQGHSRVWQSLATDWERILSTPELRVRLTIEGPPRPGELPRGVDVSV